MAPAAVLCLRRVGGRRVALEEEALGVGGTGFGVLQLGVSSSRLGCRVYLGMKESP